MYSTIIKAIYFFIPFSQKNRSDDRNGQLLLYAYVGIGDESTCANETNSLAENPKNDTKKKYYLMWTPHLQKKFLHALQILGKG